MNMKKVFLALVFSMLLASTGIQLVDSMELAELTPIERQMNPEGANALSRMGRALKEDKKEKNKGEKGLISKMRPKGDPQPTSSNTPFALDLKEWGVKSDIDFTLKQDIKR